MGTSLYFIDCLARVAFQFEYLSDKNIICFLLLYISWTCMMSNKNVYCSSQTKMAAGYRHRWDTIFLLYTIALNFSLSFSHNLNSAFYVSDKKGIKTCFQGHK